MIALIKRNLKVFLKDRGAVFFSFLSIIIILGLFLLFLNNMHTTLIPEQMQGSPEFYMLMYSWAFAGILMVGTFTIPIGFLDIMVRDFESKAVNDFFSAPIPNSKIVAGYLISSVIVTIMLSLINLTIGKILLMILTDFSISLATLLALVLAIVLSSIMFSSIFFYVSTKFKSTKAYGALSTLMGTLIGFLTGLYVPIGSLDGLIGNILNSLPTMHMASLFRKIYMNNILNVDSFAGSEASLNEYSSFVGVDISVFGIDLGIFSIVLISIIVSIAFIALSILSIRKKY